MYIFNVTKRIYSNNGWLASGVEKISSHDEYTDAVASLMRAYLKCVENEKYVIVGQVTSRELRDYEGVVVTYDIYNDLISEVNIMYQTVVKSDIAGFIVRKKTPIITFKIERSEQQALSPMVLCPKPIRCIDKMAVETLLQQYC